MSTADGRDGAPRQGAADDADVDVPWLDDDESQAWIHLLSVVFRATGPLESQLQRDSGLTLFGYLVLARLSMHPERTMRMSELADVADGSPSRLSNVVRQFQDRGWITRRPDPGDGRATLATLTDAGMAVVVEAAPGHVRAVRERVIDPLSREQQRALVEIAQTLAAARSEVC